MSDFSQNRLKVTTFHILDQDRKHLRNQLRLRSKWKKTVIIIPLLASEYTDPENRPIFETPQTVSWERVQNKLPGIYYELIDAVESEKQRFA